MSHLPVEWPKALAMISDPLGLPQDQTRMLLCLFASIPLGQLHMLLPSPTVKHVYSTLLGFFFGWFVVGNGALHVLLASVLVYFLALLLPRLWMPHVLTVGLVSYMSWEHVYRMWVDYMGFRMDVSLIMMIFVVKASTFVYNYADGLALNAGEQLHPKAHLHHHRAQRALRTAPSLLEYLSYIWFYGGLLVGPCFEMKEYLDFTDLSLFRHLGLSSIPPTLMPALQQLLYAALCYPFVHVHSLYPMIGYVNTPAYAALPFLERMAYFWITITCSRFKYYFVWYLAAAGCTSSGFGLSAVQRDEKTKAVTGYEWERCQNAHAPQVELATSMPAITNHWNIGVNNWLKHYVYFRIDPSSSLVRLLPIPPKSVANVVTKLTSAFWHGFYPAYYFFFLGAYIANEMDEVLRARLRPLLVSSREEAQLKEGKAVYSAGVLAYGVLAWLLIFACMNNLGMAFMLMRADWSLTFWQSFYFSVFWVPILVITLCTLALPKARRHGSSSSSGATNGQPTEAKPAVAASHRPKEL